MIKILIADDHPIFREGLKRIIEDIPDMYVGGEAKNGEEVLSAISSEEYDIVILDICMPNRDGLDTLKQLKIIAPQLPVIIISVYPEEQYAIRAFKGGAAAYISKPKAANELISAIRKAITGGKYVTPTLAEKMLSILEDGQDKPLIEKLSDREYQIFIAIASGEKTKSIAKRMSLSPKTVGTYRMRILEKLNMKSNAEVIRYAIENNLVV